MLTIGELGRRTGVATSALRYYDRLGLVQASARSSGHRRYDEDAVKQVGVVLFLSDVGFTLDEIAQLLKGSDNWRRLATRKLEQLRKQQADLRAARTAIEHSLQCPAGQPLECPNFWSIVERRLPK